MSLAPSTNSYSNQANSPFEAWQWFITDSMIEHIAINTNNKIIERNASTNKAVRVDQDVTDKIEMLTFIGLNYARGLCKRNEENVSYLYRSHTGNPLFSAVMAESRFPFLERMITFDDKNPRKDRHKSDRFAAFREYFKIFNDNCSRGIKLTGTYVSKKLSIHRDRELVSGNTIPGNLLATAY